MGYRFRITDLFTIFIIGVLVTAVAVASQWTLRASIIVLVLGSIGAVLATLQLLVDVFGRPPAEGAAATPKYELPTFDAGDARQTFWRVVEIWAWLLGLLAAIPLIGLPVALPLLVLVYIRFYGGSWTVAITLSALILVFIYGVYQQIMHVYWPDSYLGDWLFPD
jgi:hypothetical protein